jgi:phage gp29-like protein|tara:strand:+ start:940 stop:2817 length:1878 start_codon:yes stop_codon:yes gene_type:complete
MTSENPQRHIKSGFFDRYFSLGTPQGNLAGYKSDPYSYSGAPYLTSGVILPRRDDILLEEGGGGPRAIEKYMRLFNDSQILAAWEKLIGEIIQRPWEVYPSSDRAEDEEIAEFVRQVINRMGSNTRQSYGKESLVSTSSGFDTFIRGMCESIVLGMSIGEICWMRQGKYIVPSEIKIRDPRRFLFRLNEDGTVSPRLITMFSPVEGMGIPLRSMIMHRHWSYSNFMDVHGSGLGRQLYPLVEFRRTLLNFWLQYSDKHTTPTAVGKFSLGTPEEEVNSLFSALQRLGQETAVVIPDEMDIQWLESNGRPELYNQLITYIDQQISFVINGETTVGQETGSVGSFARDQIADSVRMRKAKAFSEELDETINSTLVRWIVELNYPGKTPPRLVRNFEDLKQREDPVRMVQVLSQLGALGYQVEDVDWLREKLNIPSLIKQEMPEGGMGMMGAGMMPPMEEGQEGEAPMSEDLEFGTELMKLFDFEEASDKQKMSQEIAAKFKGDLDDVGFQRIVSDATGNEMQISRLKIDEFTSPGEIVFVIERLLEEIRNVRKLPPETLEVKSSCETEIQKMKSLIEQEGLSECGAKDLVALYERVFRLNRYTVHRECVTLDIESKGYWRWFDPYFQ